MRYYDKRVQINLAAAFLVLLFLLFLPGISARAATLSETDILADYKEQWLLVPEGEGTTLYYCFAAAGKAPKAFVPADPGQCGEYTRDGKTARYYYIDLSALNAKTEIVFYAKYQETDTAVTFTIPKQNTLKAAFCGILSEEDAKAAGFEQLTNFSKETGYFTFLSENKAYTLLENIEWRAGTAMNYRPLSEMNLFLYRANGATIYFRINNGTELIGKETKIKLRKQANPPAVKVDGNKLTISIKATQEYRVATAGGEYGEWTRPAEGSKLLKLQDLTGIQGDGQYSTLNEASIEVRTAMTQKNFPSRTRTVLLEEPQLPKEGAEGIEVKRVNTADITKGLNVTNHSTLDYQVAIVDKTAWESKSIGELLRAIDFTAKSKEPGYLSWKTVKAGRVLKLSHAQFKDFADSYVVLCRVAAVKEDSKTTEREFRVASVIRAIGGYVPSANPASGFYLLESEEEKTVEFIVEEGWELYTSLGTAAFAKNTAKKVSFTATVGGTITIRAYAVNPETAEQSNTATFQYQYVSGAELDFYKNDWGYSLCKRMDRLNSEGNRREIFYRNVYLALQTWQPEVNYKELGLTADEAIRIVYMVKNDNPEIIHVNEQLRYSANVIMFTYRDKEAMTALLAECNQAVEEMKQQITEAYGTTASTVQKVKVIHDYLVLTKEYKDSEMAQTMAGCLTEAYTPVCMSYALAMNYACEQMGIQSVIIFGDARNNSNRTEAHAWNIINYGEAIDYLTMTFRDENVAAAPSSDSWYEMDVTWDDPLNAGIDYVRYDYFNITTAQMSQNHVRSTATVYSAYPFDECTGTEYSYENCIGQNIFQ